MWALGNDFWLKSLCSGWPRPWDLQPPDASLAPQLGCPYAPTSPRPLPGSGFLVETATTGPARLGPPGPFLSLPTSCCLDRLYLSLSTWGIHTASSQDTYSVAAAGPLGSGPPFLSLHMHLMSASAFAGTPASPTLLGSLAKPKTKSDSSGSSVPTCG